MDAKQFLKNYIDQNGFNTFGAMDAEDVINCMKQYRVVNPILHYRKSVLWFADKMEAKLSKNDHKGGWHNCDLQYMSMRLTQERKELTEAIKSKDKQRIIDECADIANFALMIADKFGEDYGN